MGKTTECQGRNMETNQEAIAKTRYEMMDNGVSGKGGEVIEYQMSFEG